MSRIVDNLIAYKIVTALVRPFEETDAYKLGIIDKNGHNLIKVSQLETSEQKDAYTFLDRLVFNIKKIINRLPGGENKLKSLITAFYLVKEYYQNNERSMTYMEEQFHSILNTNAILVEETITVKKCLCKKIEEDGEGGGEIPPPSGIANTTGSQVSTDIPVPRKKDIEKYKSKNINGLISFARRNNKVM